MIFKRPFFVLLLFSAGLLVQCARSGGCPASFSHEGSHDNKGSCPAFKKKGGKGERKAKRNRKREQPGLFPGSMERNMGLNK